MANAHTKKCQSYLSERGAIYVEFSFARVGVCCLPGFRSPRALRVSRCTTLQPELAYPQRRTCDA